MPRPQPSTSPTSSTASDAAALVAAATAVAKPWQGKGAIVRCVHEGSKDWPARTYIRPAVFIFFAQKRWAWVEPSYLDGGGSPAMHQRNGTPTVDGQTLTWADADGRETITITPVPSPSPDDDMETRSAIEAVTTWTDFITDPLAEGRRVLAMINGKAAA